MFVIHAAFIVNQHTIRSDPTQGRDTFEQQSFQIEKKVMLSIMINIKPFSIYQFRIQFIRENEARCHISNINKYGKTDHRRFVLTFFTLNLIYAALFT